MLADPIRKIGATFQSWNLLEDRQSFRRPQRVPYANLAARYDRMHDRWLRYAGGEAQAALEAALITRLEPGMTVLDAGCGTGTLARTIQAKCEGDISLTMLDTSRQILDQACDVKARRVEGSILQIPFAENEFDLAVACWSVEASGDEEQSISELVRVVRASGRILIAFCANEPSDRLAGSVLRKIVELRHLGRFLEVQSVERAFLHAGATRILKHRCRGPVAVPDVQAPS